MTIRLSSFLVALVVYLMLHSLCGAAELPRHHDWATAEAASRQSGKPIFVYVFQSLTRNVVLDRAQAKQRHEACAAMEDRTFKNPDVIKAMGAYEVLALDADLPENAKFCDKYRVGMRFEQPHDADAEPSAFAAIPAYLFLESDGTEYYRAYGFYAADMFMQLLGQVGKVIGYRQRLAEAPEDARAQADLGRLYLEMERPELAQAPLEAAVKLDPDNKTGARADAELDLIILAIPLGISDDPEKPPPVDPMVAVRKLIQYQADHAGSRRALELQYYLAVAYLTAGKEGQCEKILLDFGSIPPFLPNDQAPPNARYGYLVTKGEKHVGFYAVETLEEARQQVRVKGDDPDRCKFERKPMNPDYRNPWTEKADLLLRQLREEQELRKNPPKNH